MSVRRRGNFLGNSRLDLPHLKSIESATSNDFDELLSGLVVGEGGSYVIRGLEISMAGAIGSSANALQLLVANTSILHNGSDESGTFYQIQSGEPSETLNSTTNTKVDGSFTPNTDNYIGFEFIREIADETADQVYFWNPTTKSEFTKTVPLAVILKYKITITTSTFPSNTLPIAVVRTDSANNVVKVTDRRPLLLRLGSAGFNSPDPFYSYPWTNHSEGRVENFYSSTSSTTSPFKGGDKQIQSLKEWLDAAMSMFKEVKGTTYWYSENAGGSILRLRQDAANTVFTGRGSVTHHSTISGRINWSSDIFLNLISSPIRYKIKRNTSSAFVTLSDNQAAYIKLVRGVNISPNLVFTNGSAVVTSVGAAAWTSGLQAGDFVKLASADDSKYYEIFSVDSASQVTLTSSYAQASTGSDGQDAQYSWGVYEAVAVPSSDRHIKIASRASVPFSEDHFWLMFRKDDQGGKAKVYVRFLGSEIESGEERAVSDNQTTGILSYIGSPNEARTTPDYAGNLDTFEKTAIYAPFYSDVVSGEAFYIYTADDRSTIIDESQQHYLWFDLNGDGITDDPGLAGTGHPVNISTGNPNFTTPPTTEAQEVTYRNNIALEITTVINTITGLSAAQSNEKITVDTTVEGKVTDGYNYDVSSPDFSVVVEKQSSDGYKDNQTDYDSDVNENLTRRVARLTAMVADKAQDKTVKWAANYDFSYNTQNGVLQELTFGNLNLGATEERTASFPAKANLADGQYFLLYNVNDTTTYYPWCDFIGDLSGDPGVLGATPIPVDLSGATTALQVAAAFQAAIDALVDFVAVDNLDGTITISNSAIGPSTDSVNNNMGSGFSIVTNIQGAASVGPDTLTVVIPSSVNNTTITLQGTLQLAVNQAAWFRIDRNQAISIANISTLNVDNLQNVPLEENVFIFAYRLADGSLYLWDNTQLDEGENVNPDNLDDILNDNAYDEPITVVSGIPASTNEITGPVSINTVIPLPLDSRDGSTSQGYVVGKGVLELYLNGMYLRDGVDWEEVGTVGNASTAFKILIPLVIGDKVQVRIDTAGGYVAAGGGGGGGGEVNLGANAGVPQNADVFKQKTGVTLEFRRMKQGPGMTITQTADYIEFANTGVAPFNVQNVTGANITLTLTNDVVIMVCSGANRSVNLPAAATATGKKYIIKMVDTGNNTNIFTQAGEMIDGVDYSVTPLQISVQYQSYTLVCDGSAYWIV